MPGDRSLVLPLNADGWPEQSIGNFGELRRAVEPRLHIAGAPHYLFRGQSSASWGLVPGIARPVVRGVWTPDVALAAEHTAFDLLVPAAAPHLQELERPPSGVAEWWSVMQHYGVPTRVLDWTPDPDVALWFAARHHPESDGAVWMVHPSDVQDWMRKTYGDFRAPNPPGPRYYTLPRAPQQVFFADVVLRSARKEAQKGRFSWSRRIASDLVRALAPVIADADESTHRFRKVVVPAAEKSAILDALTREGYREGELIPDADSGLARVGRRVAEAIAARFDA